MLCTSCALTLQPYWKWSSSKVSMGQSILRQAMVTIHSHAATARLRGYIRLSISTSQVACTVP